MAPVLKTGIPERVSGVRIPPSPPHSLERREIRFDCSGNWDDCLAPAYGEVIWDSEGVVLLRYPSCMGCEKAVHKADLVSDEKTEAKT
jgi:hypothetical protein